MKVKQISKKTSFSKSVFFLPAILLIIVGVIILSRELRPPALAPSSIPTQPPFTIATPTQASDDSSVSRVREPLSQNDVRIKAQILNLLPPGEKAGILFEDSRMRIEYIESLDVFKVEILTTEIELTKRLGNDWFLSQGLSQDGICNLPMNFYLNYNINQQIPNAKESFSPLPDQC